MTAPVRRLVTGKTTHQQVLFSANAYTGHDSNGKSIFIADDKLSAVNPLKSDGSPPPPTVPGFVSIAKSQGFPDTTNNSGFTDLHGKKMPLTDDSGVTCRFVDFPPLPEDAPDWVNFMHRTSSIDFGVVVHGKITQVLDSGETKVMEQGDVCVQRGTNHAWRNTFKENCRMMFVLVPSVPVKNAATGEEHQPTDTTHLTDEDVTEPPGPRSS